MNNPSYLAHALTDALQSERSVSALVDAAIEFFYDQPVEQWLDLEVFYESAMSVYRPEIAEQLLRRSLPTLLKSSADMISSSGQSLQSWLTPELDAELRSLCASATLITAERVDKVLKHPLTGQVVQSFVEETLQRFIQRAKPSADGGSLLGLASRSALSFASRASKGALNGLGEQLQQHLGSLTNEFVSASMGTLLDQLGVIIATPEVSHQLGQSLLSVYDELREQTPSDLLSSLVADANRIDTEAQLNHQVEVWSTLIAEWISHLFEQNELSNLVGRAHQELISALSERTPRMLIGDAESLASLKDSIKQSITPQVISFTRSDQFQVWIAEYLSEH